MIAKKKSTGEERRNILGWLSKVDYGAHHEKARDLRFDGTGGWLFGKQEFEDWVESQYSSILWLYGKGIRTPPQPLKISRTNCGELISWIWKNNTEVSFLLVNHL